MAETPREVGENERLGRLQDLLLKEKGDLGKVSLAIQLPKREERGPSYDALALLGEFSFVATEYEKGIAQFVFKKKGEVVLCVEMPGTTVFDGRYLGPDNKRYLESPALNFGVDAKVIIAPAD